MKKIKSLIPGYTTTLDVLIVASAAAIILIGLVINDHFLTVIGIIVAMAFVIKEIMDDRR